MPALPHLDADEILAGIKTWVEVETPTYHADQVNKLMDLIAADLAPTSITVERIAGRDGLGDSLRLKAPWNTDRPGILILSHLDTVHPIGTLEKLPFRKEGDLVYGPGTSDMKGCAYLAYHVVKRMAEEGRTAPLPVTILLTPDEEIGSPTTQALIEDEARRNKYVLVTEAAREGGKIVTARKGVARFEVTTRGRPSHAGARHQDGRSAIREMAHQILAIERMTDYDAGITTNVGLIKGGTAINVVPEECTIEVDMRVATPESAAEMVPKMLALTPVEADTEVVVTGGMNRPPYVKDAGIAALFDHAKALAAEIGYELQDVLQTGGGSDGNFTAALGVPTLDGLGVDGAKAHTLEEHLYYSSIVPRARLVLRLIETLN